MLRPQDGPTRERKSLNGLWRFRLDAAGEGREQGWWRGPLSDAREMPVPASYNDIPADAAVRDHVGDAWLAPERAKPTGRPCRVQSRCRRSPQK
jgi:beta-glucuronidase